jgi:O-acetyl-ADP-ribose deacetylase (regulator of RNase III)
MIEFTTGDILESHAEALVNTVNCVGVMGRGIALQFKEQFPANFDAYAKACEREEVQPGRMFVFVTGRMTGPKFIVNFPTKRHWRGNSRIEDVELGLIALRNEIQKRRIRSIAIPPLGAGLGGLDWKQVRPRIEQTLGTLGDVDIVVYEPNGVSAERPKSSTSQPPKLTAGRAALIGLIQRYLGGLLDPTVTLLEVHKLMYFLQQAGEPLRLQFVQAPYGPYAENLRHVLRAVEGYYLTGYADGGDSPTKELKLVPGAVDDAERMLTEDSDTSKRIRKVAELVDGFETPFGLELLATVHWVAIQNHTVNLEKVISETYSWGDRKRQFTERQIRMALQVLTRGSWLDAAAAN